MTPRPAPPKGQGIKQLLLDEGDAKMLLAVCRLANERIPEKHGDAVAMPRVLYSFNKSGIQEKLEEFTNDNRN
jgi:hypothetical protein